MEIDGAKVGFQIDELLKAKDRCAFLLEKINNAQSDKLCSATEFRTVSLDNQLFFLQGEEIRQLLSKIFKSMVEGGTEAIKTPSVESISESEQTNEYQTRVYLGMEYPGELMVAVAKSETGEAGGLLRHYLDGQALTRLLSESGFKQIRLKNEGDYILANAQK